SSSGVRSSKASASTRSLKSSQLKSRSIQTSESGWDTFLLRTPSSPIDTIAGGAVFGAALIVFFPLVTGRLSARRSGIALPWDNTDLPAVLQNRRMDFVDTGASTHTERCVQLMVRQTGLRDDVLEQLSVVNQNLRPALDQTFKLLAAIRDPAD